MDRFPCSCGGENPNCFRCYGTGMVDTPVSVGRPRADISEMARAAALKPRPKGRSAKKRAPAQNKAGTTNRAGATSVRADYSDGHKLVLCSHCGVTVRAGRLSGHILRVHPGERVAIDAEESSSLPSGQVRCPQCRVLLNSKNLEKHLRKVHEPPRPAHPASGSAPTANSKDPLQSLPPNVVRCPRCRLVAPDHRALLAHIRIVHGEPLQATGVPASAPRGGRQGQSGGAGGSTAEPSMDGSYGWGGSFRDHGQFGSYPSFDSMDDESSA